MGEKVRIEREWETKTKDAEEEAKGMEGTAQLLREDGEFPSFKSTVIISSLFWEGRVHDEAWG